MGNIVLLDELTINKIAAGEVIERPASVVKELVENSIDAGANKITVEIKNGGISYIRITDNGKGFMPDDMEIAFERHATSKIREAADLETVTSMGFRGEALASIAAISHVELVSKTVDNEIGKKIEVKGGNVINIEDTGCPQGSTITVTDLFYNTPVRYKFLKKDFTEAGYIEDVITRLALVHPEIAIKLINSGKVIIQTSGNNDMKSVIYCVYGKDVAENIIDVDYNYEDIKITGVIGKPVVARSNRANQLFFVNKRYIKDKVLTSAAEQGYKGLLTVGKYGFLVLNIEMNPQKVDVNVHPAKLEVRFEDENKIFKAIYHAIKESLLKEDLIPDKTKIELDKKAQQNTWSNMKWQTFVTSNSDEPEKNQANNEDKANSDEETSIQNSENNLVNDNEKREEANQDSNNEDLGINNLNVVDETNENNVPEKEKHGGLFGLFSHRKKEENFEDNIDDTQNFIAQIYKNHNGTSESSDEDQISSMQNSVTDETKIYTVDNENNASLNTDINSKIDDLLNKHEETKTMDESNISEKIKELDALKIEPDYKNFDEMYALTFGTTRKEQPKVEEDNSTYKVDTADLKTAENVSIFEKMPKNDIPDYKFIGIAFSTYIIIEMDKELYIIDQHAAHERIMYEKIKANYYSDSNKDSQLMLLPDIINLSHKDMQIAKDNMEIFEKAGFVLEEFGENTIKLSGVPTVCLDLDTKELFLETLDEINTVARTAKQEIEEKFIATVACKAAVKANMALTREEVDSLMRQLLVLPNPFTCPHGRPTAIRMTREDIERKFSRR